MREIYIDNTILDQDKKFTFLTTDAVSGGTSLVVQSIVGFASTAQIILAGTIGDAETNEIVYPSHATAPTGSTIYLYGSLGFAHAQDTKLTIIDWDQVEISWSATTDGAKAVLDTIALQVAQKETLYKNTSQSSGYYFTRFKDSINTIYSDYSDPIPYNGFDDNTVFAIKKRALDNCNEEIGELITDEYLNESLWEARREYHKAPGKRPFRRKFDVDIGNVTTGMYTVNLPSDIEKPYTAENVYGVRIGSNANMTYYDKKGFDQDYQNTPHSKLNVAYTIGNQDLYCSDVRDFDDSGSIEVEGDSITYSAKGVSGGTLRISADGSYNHVVERDVWQNASSGLPNQFTVFMDTDSSFKIFFNCPIETSYVDMNIWADYYRTLVVYDSDADELDEPEYDMFVPYLEYKIKKRKNKGLQPLEDSSYIEWLKRKQNSLSNEYLGTEIRFIPDIGHLPLPE